MEKHYQKHLSVVAKVDLFPFPELISDHFNNNIVGKVRYRFKIGAKNEIQRINLALLKHVGQTMPDIVWIFKGTDILPKTLQKIREAGIKLVNYNPDHPFIRTFRSSGGKEIEQSIPFYNLHLCYSSEILNEIQSRFSEQCHVRLLPFGFELDEEYYSMLSEPVDQKLIDKVCFIGNADHQLRYSSIKLIVDHNIPIDVYGKGWAKLFGNRKNIIVNDELTGYDYWSTLRNYKVQLNIFRPHNINSHNMRTFEIPAAGGIQLAPDTPDHKRYFKNKEEIFLYNTSGDMIDKIHYLMSLAEDKLYQIRTMARNRCIEEDYSYKRRSQDVYESFQQLLTV